MYFRNFPQMPPPHTYPQAVKCLIAHTICPLVTDPHFSAPGGKGHHISKVNPSIEDKP